MNLHLLLKVLLGGFLSLAFASPAPAALKFKSQWYFSPQESASTPVGVQESAVPYSDDRRPEASGIEYSLADLQKRAEALGSWLRGGDVTTDRSLAASPSEGEILVAAKDKTSASQVDDPPSPETPEPEPAQSLAQDSSPACDGLYFEQTSGVSLYGIATDKLMEGTQLAECMPLDSKPHDFLWRREGALPIGIQTYGQVHTHYPVPKALFGDLQNNQTPFPVRVWIPEWSTLDEDVEILMDGVEIPGNLLGAQLGQTGMMIFFNPEQNGVKELRIVNLTRDEKYDFLLDIQPTHDTITILGSTDDFEPEQNTEVRFVAQADPTRFLQYYNEDVGVFFDIPSGFSLLKNKVIPHFFRYYDTQAQAERTFLWEPRGNHLSGVGDLEGKTFNLHQVLTSIRSKKEMGLDLEHNSGTDLLVVQTPLELAPPPLSQVRVNADGAIQWHQLLNTYGWQEGNIMTQIFVNPSEGEYWLDEMTADNNNGTKRKIWVMKGIDTIVGM